MDTDDAKRVAPSVCLEIRLFYVRVAPCAADDATAPKSLRLTHLRREMGVSLEINGRRVPASDPAAVPLRRDRLDRGALEVTYVSTDCVRLTGAVDFEVCDDRENLILCGSLERMEPLWNNGGDAKAGWSMDCYSAAGSSGFAQSKIGGSAPSLEVYIAGCCLGRPLILTQTVLISPRRKAARPGMLDVIPEDEASTKSDSNSDNQESLVRHRKISSVVSEVDNDGDEYDTDMKEGYSFHDGWYCETDDDGQLSWFNAGVRVGVGIGLGMCVGIGIGVGLLMRSYQATTRSFRRRFI